MKTISQEVYLCQTCGLVVPEDISHERERLNENAFANILKCVCGNTDIISDPDFHEVLGWVENALNGGKKLYAGNVEGFPRRSIDSIRYAVEWLREEV